MLKKFFSVILLVCAILLSGQVTVTPKVEAYANFAVVDDWYAFTYNGIEYYICYIQYNGEIYGGGIQVELKGVKNGKTVDNLKYFLSRDGTYDLMSSRHLDERGYISSDSKASTVFNIINSSDFKKEVNKPREVRQEERRKKEEVQRKENKIREYDKMIEANPNNAYNYHERGNLYEELKQYERAIQDYDKAIQLEPNKASYYVRRGKVYTKLKQYERAIQDYDKAIQLKPNKASYYGYRGNVYSELKQYELAIQDYDKAIQLKPNKASYYDYYMERALELSKKK